METKDHGPGSCTFPPHFKLGSKQQQQNGSNQVSMQRQRGTRPILSRDCDRPSSVQQQIPTVLHGANINMAFSTLVKTHKQFIGQKKFHDISSRSHHYSECTRKRHPQFTSMTMIILQPPILAVHQECTHLG